MLTPKIEERIKQYLKFLYRNRYDAVQSLSLSVFPTLDHDRRKPPEETEGWRDASLPFAYGKEWTSYWFRSRFTLPEEVTGREVFLRMQPQADSLAYVNGKPFGAFNPFHDELRLAESAEPGASFTVDLEVYSGHKYPGMHPFTDREVILTLSRSIPEYPNVFLFADLAVKNEVFYDLYYDCTVLYELTAQLPESSLRKAEILKGLHGALTTIRYSGTKEAQAAQAEEARKAVRSLLEQTNAESTPEIMLIGHAHIDHAWLWPLWETERKCARTFSNMCRYTEEYPEFVFVQSQPVQLEEMERDYPEIFQSVKEAYGRGQWEPNGGMWVEADCNVTGGESLIRQFLVGKKTTKRMLGYESDTLWLPDVFGYAAALPQILKGCGIDYFVTSKINWNDTTRFPFDTFVWKGLDGTGVNTHYITARKRGYNGSVTPECIADAWHNVQHKEVQDRVIMSIGEGDGGGGTQRRDLEYARRMKDLNGSPRSEWKTVTQAMGEVFSRVGELPVWQGELYLELHRGTYTSQARTKRFNRKLEGMLRTVEMLYSRLAGLSDKAGYPEDALDRNWKDLLTRQFHDIIPGSSIRQVYAEAEETYGKMTEELASLCKSAMDLIADGTSESLTIYNTLGWRGNAVPVTLPPEFTGYGSMTDSEGTTYPLQTVKDEDGEDKVMALVSLAPLSAGGFTLEKGRGEAKSPFSYEKGTLDTPFYRVSFDESMGILSLVDRETGREYADSSDGSVPLNTFLTAEDYPVLWDAWDIESDWTRFAVKEDRLESCEVVSEGPLMIQFRCRYKVGRCSALTQDMVFYSGNRRIDFKTYVEWGEDHQLLKVAFPVTPVTSHVRCEVQYGHVKRPTTSNTAHEAAQFEVCAHKWVSLEEQEYGVALLNDCKYGHDVKDSTIRLTLLKSAKAPDPEADMGHHEFVYSLLPFEGAFSVEKVVRPAYELNHECPVAQGRPAELEERALLEIGNDSIILETVKMADDGSGDMVFRLYEASGGRRSCRIVPGFSWKAAEETNMLEREGSIIPENAGGLDLVFRPFEIKTIRFALS